MHARRFIAHGLVVLNSRILVLQRQDDDYLGGFWDLPGGSVEPGESFERAVVRECFEETGLRCLAGKELSRFENLDTLGRDILFITRTYELKLVSAPTIQLSREHRDYRWTSFREALELPLVWHVQRTLFMICDA